MNQSIYDIAGTPFYLDPVDENEATVTDPSAFFTITQNGSAIGLEAVGCEGFGRRLRKGLSAWLSIMAKVQIGTTPLPGAGNIDISFEPLLAKVNGPDGGIIQYTDGLVAFAGGRVNSVNLVGAGWKVIGNGQSSVRLVDHAGVPITTALVHTDRLALVGSFLAVND